MEQPDASLDNWLDGIDLTENAPDDAAVLTDPVDLKALLLRRFAWDTMLCSQVEALLPKLGLTLSTPEGTEHEHAESHQRMAAVFPFEQMIREYAAVLSTVLSTAVTEFQGVADQMTPDQHLSFAGQNAELILSGGRAMLAQLFFMGMITYGPLVQVHSDLVIDDEPGAENAEGVTEGQLSFDDLEHGSDLG